MRFKPVLAVTAILCTAGAAGAAEDAKRTAHELKAREIDARGIAIPTYKGNEQVQRDEAMRSCGIAAQTLMLAAKAMGYDSCPMDGFDFEAVGKLINLPADHLISMVPYSGLGRMSQ